MIIWKYPLKETHTQQVAMPPGAEILTAQQQSGWIALWARVKETGENESRTIKIFETGGASMTGKEKYIATVQVGRLVYHVFET